MAVTNKLLTTFSPKTFDVAFDAIQARSASEKYVKNPVFRPKVPQNCWPKFAPLAKIGINIEITNSKVKIEKAFEM